MIEREYKLVEGLARTDYIYDETHWLLAEDAWMGDRKNIGLDGVNLTISFLSMNRVLLSEKLLYSIRDTMPGFAGEVLIIDNGSEPSELNKLEDVCGAMPYITKIVKLGKNYGVAGGRNRTIPHVKTDWLMCLDNDIYFIKNPLYQLQKDLSILGCHFLNLPLLQPDGRTLFALGGHIYVSHESGDIHVGGGSAFDPSIQGDHDRPAFLSSFLFGGASVFRCDTFRKLGGFDEGMFVGFEDIEFSIRLFNSGMKIGNSGICALIHDHQKPVSKLDRDYEASRFSRDILKESGKHLEQKYGFKIWSAAVDEWLRVRHRELDIEYTYSEGGCATNGVDVGLRRKHKIALIVDVEGWAFSNIAHQLVKHLSKRFDISVISMDVIDRIDQVLMMSKDCDLIHFFWREHVGMIHGDLCREQMKTVGMDYDYFINKYVRSKVITTSVYDHLFLGPQDVNKRRGWFAEGIDGYTVSSEKLRNIYLSIEGYPAPLMVAEDGVDRKLFMPIDLDRLAKVADRELIVGWVGNSKWSAELEDFKGLHSILKPALKILQSRGVKVVGRFADRQEGFIKHNEMAKYYAEIDVLVCVSKIEGTPNPVLEAMACGVPVISTDVGIVPQVFGALQSEFILEERSVEALISAIMKLREQPHLLGLLSSENLIRIRDWDWSIKAENFAEFFNQLLEKAVDVQSTRD